MKKYYIQVHDSEAVRLSAEAWKMDDYRLSFFIEDRQTASFTTFLYWIEVEDGE